MSAIFHEILYRPLLNALIFLYNSLPGHDFGIAIIVLTLLIRFVLYPLNQKFIRSQKVISAIQPKIRELQAKYKNDKQHQAQELLALYRAHKINPLTGFLAIIIQIPILLALFKVLRAGFDPNILEHLYTFVERPEVINSMFLGIINLSKSSALLAILAGGTQFIHSKMLQPKDKAVQRKSIASMMGKQMTYTMPLIIILIAWRLPAGIALYWTANTIFAILQQFFSNKKFKKDKDLKENHEP